MSMWTDHLAEALGVDPIPADRERLLLQASREIAHRTERKDTPLSTYLLGVAVGAREAEGVDPGVALDAAIRTTLETLPPASDQGGERSS